MAEKFVLDETNLVKMIDERMQLLLKPVTETLFNLELKIDQIQLNIGEISKKSEGRSKPVSTNIEINQDGRQNSRHEGASGHSSNIQGDNQEKRESTEISNKSKYQNNERQTSTSAENYRQNWQYSEIAGNRARSKRRVTINEHQLVYSNSKFFQTKKDQDAHNKFQAFQQIMQEQEVEDEAGDTVTPADDAADADEKTAIIEESKEKAKNFVLGNFVEQGEVKDRELVEEMQSQLAIKGQIVEIQRLGTRENYKYGRKILVKTDGKITAAAFRENFRKFKQDNSDMCPKNSYIRQDFTNAEFVEDRALRRECHRRNVDVGKKNFLVKNLSIVPNKGRKVPYSRPQHQQQQHHHQQQHHQHQQQQQQQRPQQQQQKENQVEFLNNTNAIQADSSEMSLELEHSRLSESQLQNTSLISNPESAIQAKMPVIEQLEKSKANPQKQSEKLTAKSSQQKSNSSSNSNSNSSSNSNSKLKSSIKDFNLRPRQSLNLSKKWKN